MNNANGVRLHVSGMDCANCANSITKVLEKKGLKGVFVNFQTDEVFYEPNDSIATAHEIKLVIEKLGYKVEDDEPSESGFQTKIIISALFTAPLILNHILMILGTPIHFLENGWVQLLLTIPPFYIGFTYFGKSALGAVLSGSSNMDVLIFVGSTAAFLYSIVGLITKEPSYLFF
jgi:Cu+-exporting ATPase